jgi:hypothetical protein
MPKLTTRDMAVRARWSKFLRPLVGDGPDRVSIPKLSAEIDKIACRDGDNRAELYEYIRGKRTPRAERVFEAGEALRVCGVTWASGPLALYAAGYLVEWVETTASVFPIRPGRARETAVLLAVFVPLAVLREHNLLADLGDKAESSRANARGVLTAALNGVSIKMLRSAFEERSSRFAAIVLEPIVEMARCATSVPGDYLVESFVLSALREWAFLDAPPAWRSRIATIQLQLQELRTKRFHDIVSENDGLTRTSASRTGRRKA